MSGGDVLIAEMIKFYRHLRWLFDVEAAQRSATATEWTYQEPP